MKVSAHPVLVAVALGLLGPNALADDLEEPADGWVGEACEGCTCEKSEKSAGSAAPSERSARSAPAPAPDCDRLRTSDEQAMDEAVAGLWSEWVQAP
jgi:hypothetical protein